MQAQEKTQQNELNEALIIEWATWLHDVRRRSPGTVKLYRATARDFARWLGERSLDSVSSSDIERFLHRPRKGRARGNAGSDATIRRDLSVLAGMYQHLVRRGMVRHDPTIDVYSPTVRNVQPKPIGDGTWASLWQAELLPAERMLLGLAFFGGLRRNELCALRVRNVNPHMRHLCNFPRKGGGEDTLAVGEALDVFDQKLPHLGAADFWPLVEQAHEGRSGDLYLVGYGDLGLHARVHVDGQLDPQTLNNWLTRVSRGLGIPHVTPHMLRHSCATNLLRAGVPLPLVSSYLNHSNVQTTMRYLRVSGGAMAEWLRS